MIISDEQARAVAQHLKSHAGPRVCTGVSCSVSSDLMDKAVAAAFDAPEIREDRLAEARIRMDAGMLDSHDVAEKMISRILSDSLR